MLFEPSRHRHLHSGGSGSGHPQPPPSSPSPSVTTADYADQNSRINNIINYRRSNQQHKVSNLEKDTKAIMKSIDHLGFQTMAGLLGPKYLPSVPKLGRTHGQHKPKAVVSEYTFYVIALFDVLYFIGLCPWKMVYDSEQEVFVKQEPRRMRKILITILHLCTVLFCLSNFLGEFAVEDVNTLGIANRIMLFLFLSEPISFQYNLWANSEKSVRLMSDVQTFIVNCLNNESRVIGASGGGLGGLTFFCKKTQIYTGCILLLIFYLFLGMVFSVVIVLIHGDLTIFSWNGILESSYKLAIASLNHLTFNHQRGTVGLNNTVTAAATGAGVSGTAGAAQDSDSSQLLNMYLIGVPFAIVVLYNNFIWLLNYCEIFLWGLMFRRILHLYFDGMSGKNSMESIRQFQTIARLVYDFNEIYGVNILVGVLSCAMVSAVYIWDLLNTEDTSSAGSYVFKTAMLASIGLFVINLIVAAEINVKAESITFALKSRLQLADSAGWHPEENYYQEFIVGCITIYHQVQNSTLGFRGFHFFTITYTFLAALLNLVTTYSIILLQYHLTATAASNQATYYSSDPSVYK